MKLFLCPIGLLAASVSLLSSPVRAEEVALSKLDVSKTSQGYGAPQANLSVGGQPISIGGKTFASGLGTHAESVLYLNLKKMATRFSALVGVDDEQKDARASVEFIVAGDGKVLWKSGVMKLGDAAKKVDISVAGVETLLLQITDAGDGIAADHADWADAKIIYTGTMPETIFGPPSKAVILTPKAGPEPRINGAKIFGVRPRHPIVYTVPATGERPMAFSADNLPPGATLDAKSGRMMGAVNEPGVYDVTLRARNARGETTRKFKIVVGEEIALTPPLGWNQYNAFSLDITQKRMMKQANAMVDSGLINHGWSYMNMDDGWQGARGGERNAIMPDAERFTDIGQMAKQIHDLGLKFGIYSMPWTQSYGYRIGGSSTNPQGDFKATEYNRADELKRNSKTMPYDIGPYKFYQNDIAQYAEWGVDYLKYDWNPIEAPETKETFDILRASGRDIVFSLSNTTPFENVPALRPYSNAWRTGTDIREEWPQVKEFIFAQDKWAPYGGPGHWNDPDMLVVGWVGWGNPHPTALTPDEQYTHISAWSLMSVPLLLGCDLTKLDEFTLNLLTNDEVLAVNQDPLGQQATVVSRVGDNGVIAKSMEDGSKAAGLFNLGNVGVEKVTMKWGDLGIKGPHIVRDLWRQKDLGTFHGEFSADVNLHGVVMISVRAVGK